MSASQLPSFVATHNRNIQQHGAEATQAAVRRSAARGSANTSWVADFQRMRLATDDPVNGRPTTVSPRMAAGPYAAPSPLQMGPNYHGPPPMVMDFGGHQPSVSFVPINSAGPAHTAPQQSASTSNQFDHYPRDLAFAASTEEAMEAAFASYDDTFQNEMDQWMGAHGPTTEDVPREDANAIMAEIADAQEQASMYSGPSSIPQNSARSQSPLESQDQSEFRRAAVDILETLATNQSEKFKNSSFLDLMRRISNREVVLQGDDLVDTATGAALEPESSMGQNGQGQSSDSEAGGKGKSVVRNASDEDAPDSM